MHSFTSSLQTVLSNKHQNSSNTNMEVKPFDVIILGASGFTGKYVIRESLKFINTPNSPLKSLALAGRNHSKLFQSLIWATKLNPPPQIPLLTADITDPESLRRLASQSKLILNCVGPFRLYGEPVVSACVEKGCDYLDICGEPEFMEKMEDLYNVEAEEKGSLVISACGFDSIPAELGFMFNSRQWKGASVPNRVETYLSLESWKKVVLNIGTYESAVLGIANVEKLIKLRHSRPRLRRPVIPGPSPSRGSTIEHQKEFGLWAVKLPSADAIVVRRTLANLTENPRGIPGVNEKAEHIAKREAYWSTVKPAHFGVKISSKSLLGVFRFMAIGLSIGIFGKFSLGRFLLLKFPSIFSLGGFRKKGPTEEEIESASFKMWFIGHGYSDTRLASQGQKPDMKIITRVAGPEIGYVTTPIVLVQCALVLLNQRDNLPKGGVFPPGIIFGHTDLQERLQQNGISFDVISKGGLSS